MSQPALKCENKTIFKQRYTLPKTFKLAYSCYFSLLEKSRFSRIPQKKVL